jgi:hypothetical protein
MPTTVAISIGSRTSDSVTVNTVTTTTVAGYANAWNVVLSAAVPSTTKIGDKLTTGALDYLITNISGSTLTVVGDPFTTTTAPSAGAGATTRSFPSIHTWGAAAPASLVTKDWVWKGELYQEGGGTNGEWNFSIDNPVSQTCDATRYFWLTAATGQSFRDNVNKLTNALRYNNADGVAVSISGSYARIFTASGTAAALITGIQFYRSSGSGALIINGGSGAITLDSCVARISGAALGGVCNAYNSVFYLTDRFTSNLPGGASGNLINNTVYTTGSSITALLYGNYAPTGNIVRNNTFFGFTAIANRFDKINTANSTNNVTDLAAFGWTATGNLVSKTASNQFTLLTGGSEDFRIKAGADVINAGVRDQTYTNDLDIVGTTRSLTTPTIGAWEYASTPPPSATDYSEPLSRGIFRGIERGVA